MSRTPSHALHDAADGLRAVASEPMPPVDAWFHRRQSSGAACMTVAYLAWFEGPPPTVGELRDRARQRLVGFPRLCARAQVDGDNWPHWQEGPAFDADYHVVAADRLTPLLAEPPGSGRPPWQLHLLPDEDGFALLLRAHHALLDGQSLNFLLHTLLDADPARRPACEDAAPSGARRLAWALDDLLPKARPLPLHGAVGPGRAVAFTRLPRELLTAARGTPPTSNTAVLLAAVAGALRELSLAGPPACAMVPVDVRTAEQAALLGNHYATIRLPLPATADPRLCLAALDRRIRATDLRQRALAQADLVSAQPRRFTAFGKAAGRYVDSPRYFSLLCSSLPAPPRAPVTLGPARLTAAALLPPLGLFHPVATTLTHHHAGPTLAVITDHARAPLGAPLSAAIADQLRLLAK